MRINKKRLISILKMILLTTIMGVSSVSCIVNREAPKEAVAAEDKSAEKVLACEKLIVGYVTSWTTRMPEPFLLTHINYAFAHVSDSFDGVRIDNPERLESIVALKKLNPKLKVLLSVGGWGSGRFSEMADNDSTRMAFAMDCALKATQYGLDGIDIDWEYPGYGAAGISWSDNDVQNFTLLMRDLRKALGDKRLLTIATCADPKHYDLAQVEPYVDFVNIMAYDMANPPFHQSALYPSEISGNLTCDSSVTDHIAGGIPASKLVLGIPFYGRGQQKPRHVAYGKLIASDTLRRDYDPKACVPMMVDHDGKMIYTFDDTVSISKKCDYVHDRGLRGVMFWEVNGDDEDNTLMRLIHDRMSVKCNDDRLQGTL